MKVSTALALFNTFSSVNAQTSFLKEELGGWKAKVKATFNVPREEITPMSSGKMNVIVKYKNKQGMNEVSVMSSNVYEMVAKQNVMAMELTKAEIETLMQNENIEAVEPDTTLYALELLRSRELAEDEPYG